jgi:hypothetical protein
MLIIYIIISILIAILFFGIGRTYNKNKCTHVFTYKDDIYDAAYPILVAPFHGTPVPVQIKELTQFQTMACGNFSLIETLEDKLRQKEKITPKDIIEYSSRNHAIVKEALINPTYEQILKIIGSNIKVEEAKKKLKELKKQLEQVKPGPQRSILEEELDTCRIWCDFLLPTDFISFIVSYSLRIDKSDIKKVSENILLDAAILAERGHDNPADHIDGKFTPFMRDDINRRAWYLLAMKRKRNKSNAR